jgi:hypothetical protein
MGAAATGQRGSRVGLAATSLLYLDSSLRTAFDLDIMIEALINRLAMTTPKRSTGISRNFIRQWAEV